MKERLLPMAIRRLMAIGLCLVLAVVSMSAALLTQAAEGAEQSEEEVVMPAGLINIKTVLDFEKTVSNVGSGINYIPVTLEQSNDYAASGSYSLKLTSTGSGGSSPRLSQVQPAGFSADFSKAQYLEVSVYNPSAVDYGITWMKIGGVLVDDSKVEISYVKNDTWYRVSRYEKNDWEADFRIPAGYRGAFRVKIGGEGGLALSDTNVDNFEFAVQENTAAAGNCIYFDKICLIGTESMEEKPVEVTMPAGLSNICQVIDFDTVDVGAIGSGINYIPATIDRSETVKKTGRYALAVSNIGTGGSVPILSQVQYPSFRQNWSGGQYLEMWISNPTDVDYTLTWFKINDKLITHTNTEAAYEANGKWYEVRSGAYDDGFLIASGFEGYYRFKLNAEYLGGLDDVSKLEYAVFTPVRTAGNTIYFDDFHVLGGGTASETEVSMSPELFNIKTVLDFEKTVSNVGSGINYIPVTLEQSDEYAASGSYSLKLTNKGSGGSSPRLSQVQPAGFLADFSKAQYLEVSVYNPSTVDYGITWMKIGGKTVDDSKVEISYVKGDTWYRVSRYEENSWETDFRIPAGYRGAFRIKIGGEGGFVLPSTKVDNFEFAVQDNTAAAGNCIYFDRICLIGTESMEEKPVEVTMPTGLSNICQAVDFDTINVRAIKSGINYIPATIDLNEAVKKTGRYALAVSNVGKGGSTPCLSQVQYPSLWQNWSGGQYLEMWISNPTDVDYTLTWFKINDKLITYTNTEAAYGANGKWYKVRPGAYDDGFLIVSGFEGYYRFKLNAEYLGGLDEVSKLEYAVFTPVRTAGYAIYFDDIHVLGDPEQHHENENPWETPAKFPTEKVLKKLNSGVTEITLPAAKPLTVPTEVMQLLQTKNARLTIVVHNAVGVPVYRYTLQGADISSTEPLTLTVKLEDGQDGAHLFRKATLAGVTNPIDLEIRMVDQTPGGAPILVENTDGAARETAVPYTGYCRIRVSEDGTVKITARDLVTETVITRTEETESPETGERSAALPWGVSAVGSLLTLVMVYAFGKRKAVQK